jgi:hypothetical protein
MVATLPRRSIAPVVCLCAAAAAAGCSGERPKRAAERTGTTSIVIPRLLGLDVANAVAEVHYLGMISTLVGPDRRPRLERAGDGGACDVIAQGPRPGTEVAVGDLTVTITLTLRCDGEVGRGA